MHQYLVPLHPADLPHAETLGVSWWVQWGVVLAVVAIGAWLVVDARRERRSRTMDLNRGSDPVQISDAQSPDAMTPERLVRRVTPEARGRSRVRQTAGGTGFNPVQLVVTTVGFAAGWAAIDRVRAVDTMGNFVRTDGAAQVARLGFACAALLWVGAALAPVAPRGAAVAFTLAGAIATFLAVPDRWEVRLEWWGAGSVLEAWSSRPLWAGFAFLLALLTVLAERFRPRRR